MDTKAKPQPHISWPVCTACGGAGRVIRKGGNDSLDCGECAGVGRVMPEGWKAPIWSPFGLVDAGSDPELKDAVKEGRITLIKPDVGGAKGVSASDLADLGKRIAELEKKAG